jgi:hypothetical protein
MEQLFDEDFEEMRPPDLVRSAKLYFESLALRPQIERDKAAVMLKDICETQCYAALENGDEKAFRSYCRAARFIGRYTDRYLYGASFSSVD